VDVFKVLRQHSIRPSSQRVAVASYVLSTTEHPSAEQVWRRARRSARVLSRATVYNALNLFERKGLLRAFVLAEGRMVFDPNVERHHHLIDERGRIHDVPWTAVRVAEVRSVGAWDIEEYQVVLHGRRRRTDLTGRTRTDRRSLTRDQERVRDRMATPRGERERHV